jgi:hypothetical protein
MARRPHAALAALAAELWRPATGADQVVRIDAATGHHLRPDAAVEESIKAAPHSQQLQAEAAAFAERLTAAGCPKGDIFAWLLSQPIETTSAVLAHCVARQVIAADKQKPSGGRDAGAAVAATLEIDFSKQWHATPEWLASIPRKAAVAAVAECYNKLTVARMEKLRGPELHTQAAELLTAARWLPHALRPPVSKPSKLVDPVETSFATANKPGKRKADLGTLSVGEMAAQLKGKRARGSKAAKVKQAVKNAQASKPRKAKPKAPAKAKAAS